MNAQYWQIWQKLREIILNLPEGTISPSQRDHWNREDYIMRYQSSRGLVEIRITIRTDDNWFSQIKLNQEVLSLYEAAQILKASFQTTTPSVEEKVKIVMKAIDDGRLHP